MSGPNFGKPLSSQAGSTKKDDIEAPDPPDTCRVIGCNTAPEACVYFENPAEIVWYCRDCAGRKAAEHDTAVSIDHS